MSLTNIEQSAWDDCFSDNDIVERRFGLAQHLNVARALAPVAIKPNVHFFNATQDEHALTTVWSQPGTEISLIAS